MATFIPISAKDAREADGYQKRINIMYLKAARAARVKFVSTGHCCQTSK
ncbi:MAG: hypothetical protein JNJ51_07685 [Methylobacillus glycogenes]|nr:hypothetical protein [Methylobacillus glycogenes]